MLGNLCLLRYLALKQSNFIQFLIKSVPLSYSQLPCPPNIATQHVDCQILPSSIQIYIHHQSTSFIHTKTFIDLININIQKDTRGQYFLQYTNCQILESIIQQNLMQSTNFQTTINESKEKITSLYHNSHILSQENVTNEQREADLDFQDFDIDDEQELPPEPIEDEEEDSSFINFSDESQPEEQINDVDEKMIEDNQFEEDNVHMALKQQDLDEQIQDEQKKQYVAKYKNDKFQISLRRFQATLIENSRDKNSIIYLPTGTGKTRISICSMYYYLCKYGTSKKIVFLANTIQLVKQQAQAIKQTLSAIIQNESFAKDLRQKLGTNYIQLNWKVEDLVNQVICVHGQKSEDQTITKRKRIQNFMTSRKQFLNEIRKATVTVMISQMFLNCLRRGYIKITDYSFVVFDQCHHCLGDHPYMGVMKEFYFDKKKKNEKLQEQNRLEDKDRLPFIMGLTASPVSQPLHDYKKLTEELRNLCINLDSNFSIYPYGDKITNQTEIIIQKIVEDEYRQLYPQLIMFSQRYKDHRSAYQKIKIHFPSYYKCIQQVVSCMTKNHPSLRIQEDGSKITDPELYLFYDLKECLLIKLRDLWLQLGLFAFHLGFNQMVTELTRLSGMRNHENTQLLNDLIDILKRFNIQFYIEFGRCETKFMSKKLQQLIQILKPTVQEDIESQKVRDMVLVFAFKRRTVKFLEKVLEKYRDLLSEKQKKFYKCIGVTGYAGQKKIYRGQDGHSYQSNPSIEQSQASIARYYNNFQQVQKQKYNNKIAHKSQLLQGDNKTLNNEMARMYFSKMGKVLLEVQQKYSNQVKKIIEFKRKEHRVLITTSVTEEGFDIPGCNLVISFDMPLSLKSYIQIKGRARKKSSKYIIFTFSTNYEGMLEKKKIFDNSINAIYQIAINQISQEKINGLETFKYSPSYEKVMTYGGALLNTNYALQILKSYFTSLKQPNRPYFHYIETSNICYRSIIKFPQSSTSSISYVVGKPFSKKVQALKSAAFEAIKLLKKEGLIKDDLRPSRLQQLQDELELQKYDDLGTYSKDSAYKAIFDRYVQIQEYSQANINNRKKLLKFYFKSLDEQKLEFPQLNKSFNYKTFESGHQQVSFQIYRIKFVNVSNSFLLTEEQGVNEIGILTCYSQEQTGQIFAGFKQKFQPISQESFQLKLVTKQMKLTYKQYNELQDVHKFLLSSQKNNEIQYYNHLNNFPTVLNPNWNIQTKKFHIKMDDNQKYYPLLVLLKKSKENKGTYVIDDNTNIRVMNHIDLIKKIYMFHNKAAKHVNEKPFEKSLKSQYEVVSDTLKSTNIRSKKYLLQSISKDFCFHKGFISKEITKYDKIVEAQEQAKKKNRLKVKFQKQKKYFSDWQKDIYHEQIMKMQLWKQASKEDMIEIVNKEMKLKKLDDQKGTYRFLKDFVLFPICYPTMIRISFAVKYIFQVFHDYSIALYFRKYYLSEIFSSLKNKIDTITYYQYKFYNNIILENFQKVLSCLESTGRSKYLRQFSKLIKPGFSKHVVNNINDTINSSKFNLDISGIGQNILNQSASQINNSFNTISNLNNSSIIQTSKNHQTIQTKINLKILESLKIEDILRSLTSKIYKHQKSQNYEEFQFIGDVVLKYLSTIQIYLEKVTAEEGEMHIARANLICNANLHRAAIKNKLFLYVFTTKKRKEPAPFIKYLKGQENNKKSDAKYHNTDIPLLQFHDDCQGYQYIPGKVHADVMEALIGIFYLKNKNLDDCQTLLYSFGILNKPNLFIDFKPIQRDYELPELYKILQKRINYNFKNKGLLIQSLTHASFLRYIEDALDDQQSFYQMIEKDKSLSLNLSMMSNALKLKQIKILKHETFYERLQFLGDSFLDLLVVEYLYDQGGDYLDDEGTLSFLKQSAVSNKTLGFIALKFNLHDLILMDLDNVDSTLKEFRELNKSLNYLPSPNQFSKLKIGSLKILGDAFESLIGAILIDNEFNYEATKSVVLKMMEPYIKHFTSMSFVEQCPTYKFKQYLDQNNYKKLKLHKVLDEGIINGEYLYRFIDKSGNIAGNQIRASNDKDAWDKFFQFGEKSD